MKKLLIAASLCLSLFGLQAQTICTEDRVAYVNSKNVGATGAYTLSVGAEEKASQAYHYAGPGKVGGVRVFGTVPVSGGVVLKVSLYNVDANDRPTGSVLATAPLTQFFAWSPAYFDVNFSPAVSVNANFAVVVEVVNAPGWGHDFALRYTGNGEGLGEDLASLAGTSTGFNWASAMSTFSKDGDFYIYPRMLNFNTPKFTIPNTCVATATTVAFTNNTLMTLAPMFNKITAVGYAGTHFLYTWNFGDGSAVSHASNPTHAYATAGVYAVTLTSTIEGWDGLCVQTFTKSVSVGLSVNATAIVNVACNGGGNGSVVALGSGGATPYSYSLNGLTYQSNPTIGGLIAKNYTLYIKGALGCVATKNFTITQPGAIHFTTASATNASCSATNGAITAIAAGGVAPLQYKLNAGTYQTSGSFTGLGVGLYMVTAKDANGCTSPAKSIIVNDLGGPSFTVTNFTNVSCFGGNNASISLTSSGGTGVVQYSINGGTTFQTSGLFPNLTAGTYTEVVKDAAGCTDIKVVNINEPEHLVIAASSVPLSCFGISNGQINIASTAGGTGTVSYSLNGINYQTGTHFPGLSAGTYTVYGKDVTGCLNTTSVIVTQPSAVSATVTTINTTCNGYQDGTITVVGSGGMGGYVYDIGNDNKTQSLGVFDFLAAGSYDLMVTDENGCTYNTTATITEPSPIVPVATATNSTCGNQNGGILALASGGAGSGYTYSLNGGAYGTGSFSGLNAGAYIITAKDGAGCTSSIYTTIFDANGPTIVTSNHTDVSCHNGSNGTISIGAVSGGTGTLQYAINGTFYQTSPNFNGLSAGTYNVTVKDAVGCIGNLPLTIAQPNAFVITKTKVDALCNGSSTGSVNLLVGGGTGTLAYSINGGFTYQSSHIFNNLAAGNYGFVVKDAGGCLAYTSATITQPSPISIAFSTLDVSCFGANNGALNIFASGGVGTLLYSLDGGSFQSSNIFGTLSGGYHNLNVKDGNACNAQLWINVYEPAELAITANAINDVACAGGNNGVIDISVSGGNSPYHFYWSNGQVTEDNFNIMAGNYTVLVTDKNGCTTTMSFSITQPAMPVIVNGTVTNSTGSNDGAIDITVTGGVGGYSFNWSNNATTENLSGLTPGIYTVVITDANGCSSSSTFVVGLSVGIATANLSSDEVSVYPNPANEYITILDRNGFNMDKVEIYNALGQTVYTAEPQNSKVEINTSSFSQGVYLVRIQVKDKVLSTRIRIIE